MKEHIVKGKEFNILSRSIDNASKCTVEDVTEDYFSVKLKSSGVYEIDETVELFTMTAKGQLYFETIVKEVKEDIIFLWFPLTFKYLQRREYTRIQINKEIEITYKDKHYKAKLIDLSAGGIKLSTNKQLELLKEYNLQLEVENKPIKCKFEPIRIEVSDSNFIASGRFKNISNYDRISMVQYCFIKQIEESAK